MKATIDFTSVLNDALIEALKQFELSAYVVEKPMHRKQAAAYLGISERTLDRLSNSGTIPYHTIEGLSSKIYFPSEIKKSIIHKHNS